MNTAPFERYGVRPPGGGFDGRLNRILLVCNDSDRAGLLVKSNIDATHKLDGKTREDIAFTDRDIVILQNKLERPVEVLLESLALPDGKRAIVKPSRQSSFTLVGKDVSSVRSSRGLTLGAGESCVLHSSEWVPDSGGGVRGPV